MSHEEMEYEEELAYSDEGGYGTEEEAFEQEVDGAVGEIEDEDEEELEEEERQEAEDEEEDEEDEVVPRGAGGAGGAGGQGPMIHVPGLGTFPASQLGLSAQQLRSLLGRQAPAGPPPDKEWEGLAKMPEATQDSLLSLMAQLQDDGRDALTFLLLGRGGAGKTSTLNSLLGERCGAPSALQPSNAPPATFTRRTDTGPDQPFAVTLIDTPTVVNGDIISNQRMLALVEAVRGHQVDVVLYLDRLDVYRDDATDRRLVGALTEALGSRLWDNAVLAFSRGSEGAQPPGSDFHDHVATRAEQLRRIIRKAGASRHAELPVALVENSSHCPTDAGGQKVVPGEVPWVADLYEKAAELALNVPPYEYDAKAAAGSGPDRRRRWLIPVLLALQLGAKLWLDRVQRDDACRGDDEGPFDPDTVKEKRARLRRERERERRGQRYSY